MVKILLIRHATTDAVGIRLSGRTPGVSLNEEGQRQAENLAQRLKDVPVSAIYSSPLERATETAAPVAALHQLECKIAEDFIELNYGDWTNCTFHELESNAQFKLFNTFRSSTRIPGGEMMLEAQARIIGGLQQLYATHPNQTIAIFSHADLIKSAVMHYAGIHLDLCHRVEISPASVSVVELYDEAVRITCVNNTGNITI